MSSTVLGFLGLNLLLLLEQQVLDPPTPTLSHLIIKIIVEIHV